MNDATVTLVWRVLCGVAAVYLVCHGEWLPAGVFALAAK
jgi:hypothetical protein